VNCIGKNREQKIAEVTEETFDDIYGTNLKSAMFLAQAAAKHQIAGARGGKQVHMLSVRSQLGMRGYGYSAYCATKGGLVMLVKQHALELAPHGIQVNGSPLRWCSPKRRRDGAPTPAAGKPFSRVFRWAGPPSRATSSAPRSSSAPELRTSSPARSSISTAGSRRANSAPTSPASDSIRGFQARYQGKMDAPSQLKCKEGHMHRITALLGCVALAAVFGAEAGTNPAGRPTGLDARSRA
jgi:NAD(P)-dependent dehydrogenase (short-subunit alcohol dehydrogenase family)